MLQPVNPDDPTALYSSMEMPCGAKCESGWYELKAKGKLPNKRSYHSAVVYDGKLYIYGGEDIKEGRSDDLWSLDLDAFIEFEDKEVEESTIDDLSEKFTWQRVKTHGDSPGPLAHHKACVHNQCMYMFGGINDHDENVEHFYSLDMNSFKWSKFEVDG